MKTSLLLKSCTLIGSTYLENPTFQMKRLSVEIKKNLLLVQGHVKSTASLGSMLFVNSVVFVPGVLSGYILMPQPSKMLGAYSV